MTKEPDRSISFNKNCIAYQKFDSRRRPPREKHYLPRQLSGDARMNLLLPSRIDEAYQVCRLYIKHIGHLCSELVTLSPPDSLQEEFSALGNSHLVALP